MRFRTFFAALVSFALFSPFTTQAEDLPLPGDTQITHSTKRATAAQTKPSKILTRKTVNRHQASKIQSISTRKAKAKKPAQQRTGKRVSSKKQATTSKASSRTQLSSHKKNTLKKNRTSSKRKLSGATKGNKKQLASAKKHKRANTRKK